MKKILGFLAVAAFSVASAANNHSTVEDFYFQQGYEKGYQAGLLKGQKLAYEEAKNIVARYKDQIHAYELGKYLVQNSYITAPEVYQKTSANGTSVEFVIIPSKIAKELDIADIFSKFKRVPTIDESELTANNSRVEPDLNDLNSVYLDLPSNRISGIPASPDQVVNNTKLKLAKTAKNRKILRQAGVTYAENPDSFEVVFFSKEEKADFCQSFKGLCR